MRVQAVEPKRRSLFETSEMEDPRKQKKQRLVGEPCVPCEAPGAGFGWPGGSGPQVFCLIREAASKKNGANPDFGLASETRRGLLPKGQSQLVSKGNTLLRFGFSARHQKRYQPIPPLIRTVYPPGHCGRNPPTHGFWVEYCHRFSPTACSFRRGFPLPPKICVGCA